MARVRRTTTNHPESKHDGIASKSGHQTTPDASADLDLIMAGVMFRCFAAVFVLFLFIASPLVISAARAEARPVPGSAPRTVATCPRVSAKGGFFIKILAYNRSPS